MQIKPGLTSSCRRCCFVACRCLLPFYRIGVQTKLGVIGRFKLACGGRDSLPRRCDGLHWVPPTLRGNNGVKVARPAPNRLGSFQAILDFAVLCGLCWRRAF